MFVSPARRAFTLVELLVVIAIIGVLVALLLPARTSPIKNSSGWTTASRSQINKP